MKDGTPPNERMMTGMKRGLLLLLAAVLLWGLTACGGDAPADSTPTTAKSTTTITTTTAAETTATATPETTTTTAAATTTTTTVHTKNVQNGIGYVPPETTTTKDKSQGKAIKILAVGNSFSVDAMQKHLFPILESAGYTDITLGNLYIGGCSLDTHYDNLKTGATAYTYYQNTDGAWSAYDGAAASKGFGSARWDVVTIQQVSSDSGRPTTYKNLAAIVNILKEKEPQAKILWHMTWAYQQDSDHWAFAHYGKDQTTMYNAITQTVQEQVLTLSTINGVIPSGTAIQNLRTSVLGDTLTSDGLHLKDSYGDYTAALTWFCTITGESLEAVTYRPATVADRWEDIAAAVKNAVKTPYAVTPLS